METINFPTSIIEIVPYSSNSKMIEAIKDRCGPRAFKNPDRIGLTSIDKILTSEEIIRQDYFNCEPKEIRVCTVNPQDVGLIDGETFYQFTNRMKSEHDLEMLPTGSFSVLCISFNQRLFMRQAVLTKIIELKYKDQWIHAVISMIVGQDQCPKIRLIQFDVERELNTDFNYLFKVS